MNDLHEPVRDPHFRARGMVYEVPGESQPRVAEWPAAFGASRRRAAVRRRRGSGSTAVKSWPSTASTTPQISALIEAGVVRQAAARGGLA